MNNISNLNILQKYTQDLSGVFTLSDLKNAFQATSDLDLFRQIKFLLKNKMLFRFSRGLYVTPNFDRNVLSQKLCPQSYISLSSLLSKELLIGTIPQNTTYAIKKGKSRAYKSDLGTIIHLGITPSLFFGYTQKSGVNFADKEKAFLDTLYFYQKGHKFYFNIYQDINIDLLDKTKIKKYLKAYKNQRYISFVKGVLDARN